VTDSETKKPIIKMAKRLFESGNYVIAFSDDPGEEFFRPYRKKDSLFSKSQDEGFRIIDPLRQILETLIEDDDIINWLDAETGGVAYTATTLDAFLRLFTGGCCDEGGPSSGVQSVTGYNVDGSDPLNPVIQDNYQQRWDTFPALVSGAWHTIALTGSPANRNVLITVDSGANNRTVGVRNSASSLARTVRIDTDSTASFTAKTNGNGEIEVFVNNLTSVTFIVDSYLN
jgi:hypothetical protein